MVYLRYLFSISTLPFTAYRRRSNLYILNVFHILLLLFSMLGGRQGRVPKPTNFEKSDPGHGTVP